MKEPKNVQTEQQKKSVTRQSKSKSSTNKATSSNEGQACLFIENTPFFAGKLQNGMWAIGCGNTRTAAIFKTAKQAEAYVKSQKIDWQMLGIFIQMMFNQLKEK